MWREALTGMALCGAVGAWAETPADVRACMEANQPAAVRTQSFELTSYDRTGQERVLKGRAFGMRENGLARLTAVVEFPNDLAQAAFLVRETANTAETYVYMPAVKRVTHLAGAAMGGKLWGTDFSYSEFRQIQTTFAGGEARLEGAAEQDGRTLDVLVLSRRVAGPEGYDSIRVLVDRQTCVPLRAEFTRGGTVRKLMTAPPAQLRQAGARWYPGEIVLQDLAAGTRTRLRTLQLSTPDKLPASMFQPMMFYSAR